MAKPMGRLRLASFDAINQSDVDAQLTTDGSFVLEHGSDGSSRACEPGSKPQNEGTERLSTRENLLDQMYSYEREEGALLQSQQTPAEWKRHLKRQANAAKVD